jgi:hypothetical protein
MEQMSLVKRIIQPKLRKQSLAFREFFFSETDRSDHPHRMAMHTFNQLQESASSQEETYLFMIEDIIYSSLYATFYESLLFTLKENKDVANDLIDTFEKDHEERERLIAEQTEYHLSYILNKGQCNGCPACDNHGDVVELVPLFHGGDFEFFKSLYIGMQTIQFAMEELIYDLARENHSWFSEFTPTNVLEFRQEIIEYVENKKAC